jgi:hypothetical protein
MKHAVSDKRMEAALFRHVHSTPKLLFQIGKQPLRESRGRSRAGLDQ